MQRRPIKRLPLDLPKPRIRDNASGYRGRTSNSYDEMDKTASIFRKIFLVTIIIVSILILKNIDTEFTQDIVGHVKTGITNEFDIDEALGKLQFVGNLFPDAKAVFGEQSDVEQETVKLIEDIEPFFTVPAEGKISSFFGDNNPGIDILGDKNDNMYAVANGLVLSVGEDGKGIKTLKINHGDGITTQYIGYSTVLVNIGDSVTKGDAIGTMGKASSGENVLRFETWVGNTPVNPLKLIETGK